MTIDTIEELRAELHECVFTPAERRRWNASWPNSSVNATKLSQPRRGCKPPRLVSYHAPSLGPAAASRTSLLVLAGVKVSFLEAAIAIVAPVDGLRPSRAGLSLALNLPKPGRLVSPRSRPHQRSP